MKIRGQCRFFVTRSVLGEMIGSRVTGRALKRKWVNRGEGVCGCEAVGDPAPESWSPQTPGPSLLKAARPWLHEHLQLSCLGGAPSPQGLRALMLSQGRDSGGLGLPSAASEGPREAPWGNKTVALRRFREGHMQLTQPAATAASASRCHCCPSGGPGCGLKPFCARLTGFASKRTGLETCASPLAFPSPPPQFLPKQRSETPSPLSPRKAGKVQVDEDFMQTGQRVWHHSGAGPQGTSACSALGAAGMGAQKKGPGT